MLYSARIKTELAMLGAATEVGFQADPADTARIRDLAAELETLNPTPDPAFANHLLRGRWRLIYSNFDLQRRTTLAQLSLGICPPEPVEVTELYNEIDPDSRLYDNVVRYLDQDGMPGTLVLASQYQAVDSHLLEVHYDEAHLIGPTGKISLPMAHSRIEVLQSEITYLDEAFRMVRGAFGSLYIMERLDPSPLLWARDD